MTIDPKLMQYKLFRELSENAKAIVSHIRSSEPSRKVQSGVQNVSGTYPSKKMKVTIQFESHTLELAAIMLKEHNSSVIEYYDQPPSFPIKYKNNEKVSGHLYTPDFFVIEEEWIGWEEWKTEQELSILSQKWPNRYQKNENGSWCCPPAESYAHQFGLSFRVCTDIDIPRIFVRNMRFLEDYLAHSYSYDMHAFNEIIEIVADRPNITIEELIQQDNIDSDSLYYLIATGKVYVDLYKDILAEVDRTKVYLSRESSEAFAAMFSVQKKISTAVHVPSPGDRLYWDGREWIFVNDGATVVSLISSDSFGDQMIKLPKEAFINELKNGNIQGTKAVDEVDSRGTEVIQKASSEDLKRANEKFKIVQAYFSGEKVFNIPKRTLGYWIKKYKEAEQLYGNGFIGLLTLNHEKGNRTKKLPDQSIKLMEEYIKTQYERNKQQKMKSVYRTLCEVCNQKGIIPPSYYTFTLYVKKRPLHESTKKRMGRRAAYTSETFIYELDVNTPRHGDRPFEICHIDHTELDVELVYSKTGKVLGRPWLTLMIDAFSRRIVAFYLSFDPPSYRSCMMVFRECVKRHGRLPQTLVVDNGKEFSSIYFESLLAYYRVTKKTRPGAKPRYGSVCERLFGTTNQMFIHNLSGNTQIMKEVRKVTKEVNPKQNAVWHLADLLEKMKEWAYEVYDTFDHSSLGESPRECFLNGLARTGNRKQTLVANDDTFYMLTLPSTRKGTAKVEAGRGIKVNHIYYWSDSLRDPEVEGSQAPVRYDPFNMGILYAYIQNRWVLLNSEHFSIFENRTEKEIQIASEELKRRRKLHGQNLDLSGSKLAKFLQSIESNEALEKQRMRDSEVRSSFEVIPGGKTMRETKRRNEKGTLAVIKSAPPEKRKVDFQNLQVLEEF
ncbi:TnsA endonuclease N-terminal domain-containing protein [Cohnella sp. GCM10020058]|uniref:TnsA endonuclease N-terminal domain-containing protein n=1 Tax=Cohnella sp. GCM10020058 TaxID=3317330 RepID=UPI003628141C